ncbi:hypothetical protein [Mannheimia bovis]|uniref:DUF3592 domain-containing protein n=1 Tax=Mannheimia bovis TaxID=2770636 RepID=A0A7H1C2T3_9PAST|nr:hypothetical protein [Mannheimia bovis]QNS15288.1 hypothetical protein ICJ55_00580 [Mannheimia bovis]
MKNLLGLFLICFLIYVLNLERVYEIDEEHTLMYFIISYVVFLPWIIKASYKHIYMGYKNHKQLEKKRYFSKKKQEQHEKELEKYDLFGDVISVFLAPIIPAIFLMPVVTYHYTAELGRNVVYTADVYDKEIHRSYGKYTHIYHYVRIVSKEFNRETLNSRSLYERVNVGSKISIMKRTSFLGSYIKYGNIGIILK